MLHRTFGHRAAVDFAASPESLASRFSALLARAPSDRVETSGMHTVTYREEPPWYFTVTYGATQGLAILTHITSTRTHHSFAATSLAVLLDVFAIYCLVRLLFALAWRMEIRVGDRSITIVQRLRRHALRIARLDVDDLTAALVVGTPGRRRVVLVSARNEERAMVFRERLLDPPALAVWMADLFAILASGAAAGWSSEESVARVTAPTKAANKMATPSE
jgi:hypothetical protein